MEQNILVYVIGEPGVGKTTTVNELVSGYNAVEIDSIIPHIRYADNEGILRLAQIGRNRGTFSGTDALPMNIIDKAESFFDTHPYPRILAEGARLANKRFLDLATQKGYKVLLAVFEGESEALERRQARGTKQNETWVKGRRTATQNLAKNPPQNVLVTIVKASLSVRERAEILRNLLEL